MYVNYYNSKSMSRWQMDVKISPTGSTSKIDRKFMKGIITIEKKDPPSRVREWNCLKSTNS
jgi:hypothetical protein